MKSKVYFAPVKDADDIRGTNERLKKLLEAGNVLDFILPGDRVAVKMHFGEGGNTGYVRPEHIKVICEEVARKEAAAVLSDTNTLYRGRRTNSADHLVLAREHGFTREGTGADVVIPDDSKKENTVEIEVGRGHIKKAKIARIFAEAEALLVVSHFKGHMLSGFGGALKNVAMGCATREGKLAQHCRIAPHVYPENCVGCGACEAVCPTKAITLAGGKAALTREKCVGCASCIEVCPTFAMFIDMDAGSDMQEKMAEYCLAVLKGKRAGYINFAIRINKECDCWGKENPRIAPDVGVFASSDPVSVDKACFDMVNKTCGKDIFKDTHPEQDGTKQLGYAHKLGLGNLDYELIEVK